MHHISHQTDFPEFGIAEYIHLSLLQYIRCINQASPSESARLCRLSGALVALPCLLTNYSELTTSFYLSARHAFGFTLLVGTP